MKTAICARVATYRGPALPGMTRRACQRCHASVLISAATVREQRPDRFICLECWLELGDDGSIMLAPTPGQMEELRQALDRPQRN